MKKVKPFISLFVIIALVAFTVFSQIKVNNCKAYSVNLNKSEYQLHRFWYFPGSDGFYLPIPLFLQCTTSNTLSAVGDYVNNMFISFYHDDWCVIVTDGTANVDPTYYYPESTEYFDSFGNIVFYYNGQRTSYSVLLSPDWILLCASYTNIYAAAPIGGHITGYVNGRFNDPPGNPISSQVFLATTAISF